MSKRIRARRDPGPESVTQPLRIIGGRLRGSKLLYHGDRRTRPMKDRVREALFNLVGPEIRGKHVIDLFAGTGALGLEAISRGAAGATFLEKHFPTAALIEKNIAALGVGAQCEVIAGDTFFWVRQEPEIPATPWIALSSPPYDFYVERSADMIELLQFLCDRARPGCVVVAESDERFDVRQLPDAATWDIRAYPPAVLALRRFE